MNDKPQVSKARHKRAHEKTRQAKRRESPVTLQLILAYLFTWTALMLILNFSRGVLLHELTPGQLAPATVLAVVDFETVDLAATDRSRERAASATPPVLSPEVSQLNDAIRKLNTLFAKAAEAVEEEGGGLKFAEAVELLGLGEELGSLPLLFNREQLEALLPRLQNLLDQQWRAGLLSPGNLQSAFEGSVTGGEVQLGADGPLVPLGSLSTPAAAAARMAEELRTSLTLSEPQTAWVEQLFLELLEPNLLIDTRAHRAARERNRTAVDAVRALRRQGTTLMEARIPISPQVLEDLRAHQLKLLELDDGRHYLAQRVGQGLYLAVGLAVSLGILYLMDNPALRRKKQIVLWVLLTVSSLLLGQFFIYLSANLNLFGGHLLRALLPLALAPMLGTILYGPRQGLAVGFASSLAHALQHDMDLVIFFSGLSVTVTSAICARAIHRRSNLFRAGLWIGGINSLILVGAGHLELVPGAVVAQNGLAAFGAGLLTALMVLLLISPFEYLFGVTTDIRLLELSDMGHPLLARLALEAPGTYHHSLMVANLAQAAAREIRANDLLVRVCAYYHDIGKMSKPEFFIENIRSGANPHDDLSPSMSRLLIISHVKEGVSLARRYKLPGVIVDGIEQHHGTGVIQYFYHRARSRAEESEKANIKIEDYRYPGPKPLTTEMGILLLADSIEAASRSIDKNKPGQIEGLVNEIIADRVKDGQLDLCDLTLAQIHAIRRTFIFNLNNMLHGRVAYPKDEGAPEKLRPGESSRPSESSRPGVSSLPAAADADAD